MTDFASSLLIGILFGASLDMAGFGSAKKLNAQFLLRDFSMFKVMFGAIVVSSAIYFLFLYFDFAPANNSVIPTLNLGILAGGFASGIGLVVGGYCPGTAIAGAAGGRIDAMIFFLMAYSGYRLVAKFETKWNADFHSPLAENALTLPELTGLPVGAVILGLGAICWLGWKAGNFFSRRPVRSSPAPYES